MHLIISHAAGAGAQCQAAIAQLALPNLDKLLRLLHTTHTLHGTPENLTPLPERVQASGMGLHGQDGLVPWAAAEARERGLAAVHGGAAWAWITPCHWGAHAQHVEMRGPAELDLRSDESEALRTSMADYFAEDGIVLHPSTDKLHKLHERWLAFGAIFHDLPTASLQRVANASINPWLPRQPQAKELRRLQSEMQMLLYTHPVNDAREARGVPSINAFWVSGTGTLPDAAPDADPDAAPDAAPDAVSVPGTVVDTLRRSALQDDAPSWTASWHTLDQTLLADALARALAGTALQITLCGENKAVTLAVQQKTWWQSLHQRFRGFRAAPVPALLQSL